MVARILQKDPKDQTAEDAAVEGSLLDNLMMVSASYPVCCCLCQAGS